MTKSSSHSNKNSSSAKLPDGRSQEAVLVTGASGFIGRSLVKKLANEGHTVVAMYRNTIPETTTNVYPVCSDLSNVDLLAVPLRGVDTVIHLAWENTYLGSEDLSGGISDSLRTMTSASWEQNKERDKEPSRDFRQGGSSQPLAKALPSNLKSLKNLIAAIEESKAQRLIFISAIGCHRKSEHKFLQEKFVAEGLVINSKIKEKVVLRTSLVYGGETEKYDPFVGSIKELLSYPAFYPVPYPKLGLHPTHIADLVNYMASLVAEKPEGGNSLVQFCGDEEITTEDLVKLLAQRHAPKSKVPIKGPIGLSLLYILEKSSSQKPLNPSIRQYLSAESEYVKSSTKKDSRYKKISPERARNLKENFGSYK